MRDWLSILTLSLCAFASAQSGQGTSGDGQFHAVHPDVVVYVKGFPNGVNTVQITMVDAQYPSATLSKQVADLCQKLNSPAQDLQIYAYAMGQGDNLKFLQASFATAGLADGQGNANLTPLVQAFAGVPAPFTIKGMEVFYQGFDPPIKSPKNFTSSSVVVSGREGSDADGVEYSIQLLSQNPSELLVMSKAPAVEPRTNPASKQNSNPIVLWCLILIAGVAAGALVYFFLVKRLSTGSPTSLLRKP